jgi:hypothetical protein
VSSVEPALGSDESVPPLPAEELANWANVFVASVRETAAADTAPPIFETKDFLRQTDFIALYLD